jgi:hypothetical protein
VAPDSFEAAIKGAFYAEEMQAMLAEGRLSDYRQYVATHCNRTGSKGLR